MELDKATNNLDNLEQIDSDLSALASIDSDIESDDQIETDLGEVIQVEIKYFGEDTDNIVVQVDNSNKKISATLKKILYNSKEEFPEVGSDKLLYIDLSNTSIWFYDIKTATYKEAVNTEGLATEEFVTSLLSNYATTKDLEGKYATNENVDNIKQELQTNIDKTNESVENLGSNLQEQINNTNAKFDNYATNSRVDEIEGVAKGANQAVSFGNYSTMITVLNALGNSTYNIGQNVMIVTLGVPDLWISNVSQTNVPYTYVSDEQFVSSLKTNGSVQVGHYILSALETQKVDLTNYREKITNASKLYATDENGNQTEVIYGRTTDAYGIVQRGEGGQIAVADAINDDHATNLGQVKNLIPGNYVTTDTEQAITAIKTFNTDLVLANTKTLKGKLANGNLVNIFNISQSGNATFGDSKIGYVAFYNSIQPSSANIGVISLGAAGASWKDLYLLGKISNGTESVTVKALRNNITNTTALQNTVESHSSSIASLETDKANKSTTYSKTEVDGIKQDLQEQITIAASGEYTKVTSDSEYQPTFDADTKLDKITSATGIIRAYAIDADGTNKTLAIYQSSGANSIARRTATGTLKAATPTADDDLTTMAFVNSSISTATATFRGTVDSVASLPTTDVDMNDYAFVVTTDSASNTLYQRYKYDGSAWVFEYELNNSSFTASQWETINSGITSVLATQISTNETNIETNKENISTISNNVSSIEQKNIDQDNEIATKVSKSGDTMTGGLTIQTKDGTLPYVHLWNNSGSGGIYNTVLINPNQDSTDISSLRDINISVTNDGGVINLKSPTIIKTTQDEYPSLDTLITTKSVIMPDEYLAPPTEGEEVSYSWAVSGLKVGTEYYIDCTCQHYYTANSKTYSNVKLPATLDFTEIECGIITIEVTQDNHITARTSSVDASEAYMTVDIKELFSHDFSTANIISNNVRGMNSPVVDADLTRKDYVDSLNKTNVKLTGNQTILGKKIFSGATVLDGPVSGTGINNLINTAKSTLTTLATIQGGTTRAYYALWKWQIPTTSGTPLYMIGGITPAAEGNKTVYFRMNDATGTDVFGTQCLYLAATGLRTGDTSNGWQYATFSSKSQGSIVQVSSGSVWLAIGY